MPGIVAVPCGLLIAWLASSPSWAHPGHGAGGGDWRLRHYLTEPEHVAIMAVALLVIGALVWRAIRARKSR